MAGRGFALAGTALGAVAIAWSERGVANVLLPQSEAGLRVRVARRCPDAYEAEPPATIREMLDRMVALIGGGPAEFDDVALDLGSVPDFDRQVYEVARTIPRGGTLTYGALASALGDPRAAREVGAALGRNPVPIIVPCHRVLAAGGKPGGFSAPGGTATKLKLLAIEGVAPGGQPDLFGI